MEYVLKMVQVLANVNLCSGQLHCLHCSEGYHTVTSHIISQHLKSCWFVMCNISHVQLCVTLWTVACQAPLSMEFSRQEY